MSNDLPQRPVMPETPLSIFARHVPRGKAAFFVKTSGLAGIAEMRDIADEEIAALAQIIYNAYRECKQP